MVNYRGKFVLAPMVRSGELPTRLLSLKSGADLVWSPEIVDKKIITCKRQINQTLNTVDFIDPSGKLIFSTYKPIEAGKLIFQMGSADPELAVQAGLKVIEDVDGIDLNCGCPKNFSVHSGMGAALLSNPGLLCSILDNLVKKIGTPYNKPISCKIRLLKDLESTLELVEKICQTGIKNLTLHCRTRDMRNRQEPMHEYLPEIISLVEKHDVSFIINGNLMNRLDMLKLQDKYGSNVGAMVAESAECNPTIFSMNPMPWNKTILDFLKICTKFNNHPSNTKYILLNQIPSRLKYYQLFAKLKTNADMLDLANQIQNDDDKFINKIKFKSLQKDKLMTLEEYKTWQLQVMEKLKDDLKSVDGPFYKPVDFEVDFTDVSEIPREQPKPEIPTLKRKLPEESTTNKTFKPDPIIT